MSRNTGGIFNNNVENAMCAPSYYWLSHFFFHRRHRSLQTCYQTLTPRGSSNRDDIANQLGWQARQSTASVTLILRRGGQKQIMEEISPSGSNRELGHSHSSQGTGRREAGIGLLGKSKEKEFQRPAVLGPGRHYS